MSELICYCFNLTRSDIIADLHVHAGRSTIIERIKQARRAGECRCSELHPQGR